MDYMVQRLKEPTTWQGIVTIVTGFGVAISPELSASIVAVGVAAFGIVSVVIKERGAKDAE